MYPELKRQIIKSRYLKKGMEPELAHAAETRWLKKPVLEYREISLTGKEAALSLEGPGELSFSRERTISGSGSVKVTLPTALTVKRQNNRAYGISTVRRPFAHEDLTHYNRLSVWVYADAPGFRSMYFSIQMHNEGEHVVPLPGRFEGSHEPCLPTGSWKHVVWEMPSIYRDCVSSVTLGVSLLGRLPEGAETVSVYYDQLRLEVVEEENYLGFDLRKNAVAYCHSGYRTGAVKQAFVQHCAADVFTLLDEEGRAVYTGRAEACGDGFRRLDFTGFRTSGRYTLTVGGFASKPFFIGDNAYLSAAWKTLSFFFTERCGADIPGVHGICHQDVYSVHPDGRKIHVSGGWHDAGDVTQGIMNTVESANAMLDLAAAVRGKEDALCERALEEARWGIDWVLGTRFGDGYRHLGSVIGIWTNNITGDGDDIVAEAGNDPLANFAAAALCAKASAFYRDDPVYAGWLLRCAREDFSFAFRSVEKTGKIQRVIFYAQASISSSELFAATGEHDYLAYAADFAHVVAACQQQEPRTDFSLPLAGFFYEDESQKRILSFSHRSYEHAPLLAFALLLRHAPAHPDASVWKRCMELYGGYIKSTAGLIEPYGLLPAGIYEYGNTDYSAEHHEGDRTIGMPSMEEYNAEVLNGIKLSDTFYLRRFPVAYQFRGFHATLMGKAKAAAIVSKALGDSRLMDIAVRQMEWILGCNPFAMSSVYGEGYDYPPLYVAFSNQLVGAVPVGFETFENLDLPYFPMQVSATYKEVWVHTTCRLMWLIADLF